MSDKEAQVDWDDDGHEYRKCNVCGEIWIDTGDYACPFCGSMETETEEEEEAE